MKKLTFYLYDNKYHSKNNVLEFGRKTLTSFGVKQSLELNFNLV